ncbi:MAG: glycosyltransferase family 9 protein [bacterium]
MIKIIYLFLREGLFNSLCFFFSKQSNLPKADEIKKILIIRIDRIGDVILSTPALKAVRKRFPSAHISVLVSHGTQDLLLTCKYIDEIILFKNLSNIRKRRFDLAIDLHLDYPLKTALIAYLSGARYRLGFNVAGKGIFFNIKLPAPREDKSIIENTLNIAKILNASIEEKTPEISVIPEAEEYIRNYLIQENVLDNDLLVAIHPGGHYLTQQWLPDRFAELANRIIKKYKAKIIIIGASKEKGIINQIEKNISDRAISLINQPVRNIVAVIQRCNLLICNNSGPLHIATALGTPTVSTMGPTIAKRWWPSGEKNIVIRKDIPCIGCNSGYCRIKTHDCMRLITVDEMFQAVEKQIGKWVK